MQKKRKHLLISGRVQGVSYRMNTLHQAQAYNLTGWVRNLPNGQVEVIAEGDAVQLNAFIDWCYQGPEYAEVSAIKISTAEANGEFSAFHIR